MTSGFLLVDKPGQWTSHDVVAKVRKLAGLAKVGHAGTLDPMATGLLVLGLDRATRLLRFVQAQPKTYVARAVFGLATDSLDADGQITERRPMDIDEDMVRRALPQFVGKISQVPPMVSAVKVGGRRLHEIARAGQTVERQPRPVEVYLLELLEFLPGEFPQADFRIGCGTGTYVRVLINDVARSLGGRAHLTALRRLRIGSLHVDEASTLGELTESAEAGELSRNVLSAAAGLRDLPAVQVGHELARGISHGRALDPAAFGTGVAAEGGPFGVVDMEDNLLAVYRLEGSAAKPEVVLT